MTLRRTGDWGRSAPLARRPFPSASPLARRAVPFRARPFRLSRPSVSPEEREARRVVRERAQGRCEGCLRAPAVEYSHRVGRAHGGPWHAANALHLCGPDGCHLWAGSNRVEARSVGWILYSTDEFLTFPVLLPNRGYVLLGVDGGFLPVPTEGDAA